MKRVSLLPNLITAFSLACGLFVIFKMSLLSPGEASYPVIRAAALLLLVAGVADMLDGATARLIRAESEFGVIFDSLSDAISFGVAPAVITLKSLNLGIGDESQLGIFMAIAAMLYAICGVLRLVRHSVTHSQRDVGSQEMRRGRMARYKVFTGLPIPAAAGAIVSLTLLLSSPQITSLFGFGHVANASIVISALLLIGYLMVSRWRFPGIKLLRLQLWSYNLIFLTIFLVVLFFYGILYLFPLLFFTLSWGYIFTAWGIAIRRNWLSRRGALSLEES